MEKKLCLFICAVFIITLFTGCKSENVFKKERYITGQESQVIPVLDDLDEQAKKGVYKSDAEAYKKLDTMELKIQNDSLALYMGKYYDIAVLDKETGKIFFSNEALYNYNENAINTLPVETKRIVLSQLDLEYFDSSNNLLKMSTYPDCFIEADKKQVAVETKDNKLHVQYKMGQSTDDMVIIQVFTKETYNHYKDILEKAMADKKITKIEYGHFANCYTEVIYDQLDSSSQKKYSEKYPYIEKLGTLYVIKTDISQRQKQKLVEISQYLGISQETIEKESKAVGGNNSLLNKSPYFIVPIIYELDGRDVKVTVETEKINYEEGYKLTKINVLSSFGASLPKDEGYIFLPEGSGIIINNDEKVYGMDTISVNYYGADFAKKYNNISEIDRYGSFPVYGIKSNNSSIFAITENGDAMGGVTARMSNSYSPYNIAGPYFNYLTYDNFDKETIAYVFSHKKPTTPYQIRYHFLYGEGATYTGMAKYFQRYLEKNKVLTKGNVSEELKLDIDIIGSIRKKVRVVGVPIEKEVGVTTFEEADKIINFIKNAGVKNLEVNYSGAVNGGLDYKSPNKLIFQKELGGKSGYTLLLDKLNSMGGMYLNIDFTKIYRAGNGIGANLASQNDISKALNRNYAEISEYSPESKEEIDKRTLYFINPLRYESIVNSFIKNYSFDNKKIYLSTSGTHLSANYDKDSELTRQESKILTENAFHTLKDSGFSMKFDSGNLYALRFAQSLTNIETVGGNSRLESYSIPFVGMVLKGYMEYTCKPLNQDKDYKKALLKAIESGAGLSYKIMAAGPLAITNTNYTDLYSISFENWSDKIVETYERVNKDLKGLNNQTIKEHVRLQDNVFQTTYENGKKVIVNYNNQDVYIENVKVGALDYTVINK